MEEVVLILGIVLAAWATFAVARRSRQAGTLGPGLQVGVGVACGTMGALAALVPHADVLPDRFEPILGTGLLVVLVVLALAAVFRWSTARSTDRQVG